MPKSMGKKSRDGAEEVPRDEEQKGFSRIRRDSKKGPEGRKGVQNSRKT